METLISFNYSMQTLQRLTQIKSTGEFHLSQCFTLILLDSGLTGSTVVRKLVRLISSHNYVTLTVEFNFKCAVLNPEKYQF